MSLSPWNLPSNRLKHDKTYDKATSWEIKAKKILVYYLTSKKYAKTDIKKVSKGMIKRGSVTRWRYLPTLVAVLPAIDLQLVGVEVIGVNVVGGVAGQLDGTKPGSKKCQIQT